MKNFPVACERVLSALGSHCKLNIILPVALFGAIYLFINAHAFREPGVAVGDYALITLEVEKAKRFESYLGPYSRTHIHHPGPILFYYYALSEGAWRIFGVSGFGAQRLSQLILNLLWLAISLIAVSRFSRNASLTPVFWGFFLFSCTALNRDLFHDLWGPVVIVLPMVCFVLCAAVFSLGSTNWLFPLVASAVFVVQNHIGSIAVVIPVAILAVILWKNSRVFLLLASERIPIWGSAIFVVLAFSPVLFEALKGDDFGNIGAIWRTVVRPKAPHSFTEALDYVSQFYSFGVVHSYWLPLVLILALLLLRLTEATPLHRLRVLLCVSIAASVFGARKIDNLDYQFVFWWQYGLASLTYLTLTAPLLDRLPRYLQDSKGLVLSLTMVLSACLASVGAIYFRAEPSMLDPFYLKAKKLIDSKQAYRIVLHDKEQWKYAAWMVSELYAKGVQVCVPKRWEFMFGTELVCTDKHSDYRPVHFYNPHQPPSSLSGAVSGANSIIQLG